MVNGFVDDANSTLLVHVIAIVHSFELDVLNCIDFHFEVFACWKIKILELVLLRKLSAVP